jgi:hypothetical protein
MAYRLSTRRMLVKFFVAFPALDPIAANSAAAPAKREKLEAYQQNEDSRVFAYGKGLDGFSSSVLNKSKLRSRLG